MCDYMQVLFIVIEKATVSYKDSFHFCALFLLVAYLLVSNVSFFMLLNDSALQKLNPEGYIDVECHPVISVPAPHQYREVKPQDEIPVSDVLNRCGKSRAATCMPHNILDT